jgi:hypothetical protein
MLHIVPKFLRVWRRRSVRDAVTIVGLCFVTFIVATAFDIFGYIYEIIKRYETYELDEVIVFAFVLGFLMVIYALRRVQELKLENHKRRRADRKTTGQALLLTTAINNMSQGLRCSTGTAN